VASLATTGRICAASCVTSAEAWRSEASAVVAATARLPDFELGLHFNLTEGAPLSPDLAHHWPLLPRLERLMVLAHFGRLPEAPLAIELRAQRAAFADAVGHVPAFIDGHQHVHHLPRIRDVVMQAVVASDRADRPALRNTGHVLGPGHAFKRSVIEGTGGRALQRGLRAARLGHNAALLGVYDFRGEDYRRLVRGWLANAPAEGSLVFCHPRHGPASNADPIAAARGREALYLASDEFAVDLAEAGFTVGPTWQSSSDD